MKFGSIGTGEGQLNDPRGIGITHDGEIMVSDSGTPIPSINFSSSAFKGTLVIPVAPRPQKKIEKLKNRIHKIPLIFCLWSRLINTLGNHRVQIFTPTGTWKRGFGRSGSYPGCFGCPCGIATDVDGNIVVCDKVRHTLLPQFRPTLLLAGSQTGKGHCPFLFPVYCLVTLLG